MGTIYVRGAKLWLGFKDAGGNWVYRSSGYDVGQEALARRRLEALEAAISEGATIDNVAGRVPTVAEYIEIWTKGRIAEGLSNASRERGRLQKYVAPSALGPMRIDQVERRHVRAWLTSLKTRTWQRMVQVKGGGTRPSGEPDRLAPRTLRATHGILRSMFESAVEVYLQVNPAKLKRNELPKKRDKNPAWRHTAVYTRGEVEQLISDERIPFVRRVTYALGFLGGLRAGEVSALRWRHFEMDREPLGCMHVVASYNKDMKREQPPKSGYPREVPVHQVLACLLAKLKLQAKPKPDDLVVPSSRGTYRTDRTIRDGMEVDFPLLGLRWRRFHDARRTLTSLARAGGASKDVLRWVTHGPEDEEMVDVYTSLPWPVLADAVTQFKVGLLGAEVRELRAVANAPTTAVLRDDETRPHVRGTPKVTSARPEGFEPSSDSGHNRPRQAVTGGSLATNAGSELESPEDSRNVGSATSGAADLAALFEGSE